MRLFITASLNKKNRLLQSRSKIIKQAAEASKTAFRQPVFNMVSSLHSTSKHGNLLHWQEEYYICFSIAFISPSMQIDCRRISGGQYASPKFTQA